MADVDVVNLVSSDDEPTPNPPKRVRLQSPETKPLPQGPLSAPNPDADKQSDQPDPSPSAPAPATPSHAPAAAPTTPEPAIAGATDPATPAAATTPTAPPKIEEADDEIAFVSHTKKSKGRSAGIASTPTSARPGSTVAKQEPSAPASAPAPLPSTPSTPHKPAPVPPSTPRGSSRRMRPSSDARQSGRRSRGGARSDEDDGVEITQESMGANIMVDAPHPRYMCGVKPFKRQRRDVKELFCKFCHCYVCDVPAPSCISWKEHCRAIDNPLWNGLRQSIREQRETRRKDPAQSGTMFARIAEPRFVDDVLPVEEDSPDDGVSSDSMDNVQWYPPVDHKSIEEANNQLGSIMSDSKEFGMADLLKYLDEPVKRTSALRAQDVAPFDLSKFV